jgi:hypothetical protein
VAVPVNATVAPAPPVIVPEMLYVATAVAVKFTPVTLELFTVTDALEGLKISPVLLGVTVYVPFKTPLKL